MNKKIPQDWLTQIENPAVKETLDQLEHMLEQEEKEFRIFPPGNEIFRALELTPFEEVRVVILGQDPYHGLGQANGLAFSVRRDVKIPPSLRNIFKELHSDLGISIPNHGELEKWAKQGVLLLNASLSVREKTAGSHAKKGWKTITDAIVDAISAREESAVFILWGAHARKNAKRIASHHVIIESAHPSPLSAYAGFWDSKPFSQTNTALANFGVPPIDWEL